MQDLDNQLGMLRTVECFFFYPLMELEKFSEPLCCPLPSCLLDMADAFFSQKCRDKVFSIFNIFFIFG